MKIGALFAGYGGLDLAANMVLGGHPAWFSEIDSAPSRILAHHWPQIPNLGDLTKIDWTAVEPVDVLTGGFPCQDVSTAGLRRGLKPGTRSGLWSHFAAAIDALRPPLVIIENVRGLLSAEAHSDVEPDPWDLGGPARGDGPTLRALGAVLGDLADLGYDAEWQGVRAADAGAPHGRFRVFVIAYPADLAGVADAIDRAGARDRIRASARGGAGDQILAIATGSEPAPDADRVSDAAAGAGRSGGVAGLEGGSDGARDSDRAGAPADRDPDDRAIPGGTPADAARDRVAGRQDESGRQPDADRGPLRVPGSGGASDRLGTEGALPDAGRLDRGSGAEEPRSARAGRATGEHQRPSAAPADAADDGHAPAEDRRSDLRSASSGQGWVREPSRSGRQRAADAAPADADGGRPRGEDEPRGVGRLDGGDAGEARERQRPRPEPGDRSAPAPADTDDRRRGEPDPRLGRLPEPDADRSAGAQPEDGPDAPSDSGRLLDGDGVPLRDERRLEEGAGAWGSDPRPAPDAAPERPQRDQDPSRREPLASGSDPRIPGSGGDPLRTPADPDRADRGAPADADRGPLGSGQQEPIGSEEGRAPSGRDSGAARLDWGAYEPAVRRWERVLGRVAPAPTEVAATGAHRLSPLFVEWMMGLPEGHVTEAGLTRNEQLKALGNGVVPQQAALALTLLLERVVARIEAR